MPRYFLFAVLLFPLFYAAVMTQANDFVQTTAHRRTTLHDGPGHTYHPVGLLNPGLDVQIVQRNATGNWVRVQRLEDGTVMQDGWVMLGFLNIPQDLSFSTISVTRLPDADSTNVDSRSIRKLYDAPVIPTISDAMLDVYERGQELGRDSRSVTKIGDSLSADPYYLTAMAAEEQTLGPFDYLADTVTYYSTNVENGSIAAQKGLSSVVVFDPFWARSDACEPNETPLECEYRVRNPSVAFIMFGPNDVLSMNDERYRDNMTRLVEDTMALGIIPVLSTFSYHPEHDLWWQSVAFNVQVVEIAEQYEVPLVNLWAASRPLEEYGLDRDRIHMKQSGFAYLKFDTGHETFYGTSLRNLLAVRTLHEIRLKLELELNDA